ncbi:MAG: ribulose-phosphate 3-epimerase [Candidatus Kapaibacterium sp.]
MPHPLQLAPSLLSADFSCLRDDVARCAEAGADILHIDVMDGHFVPNITIGPLVVKALRPHSDLLFDCHHMISDPDRYVGAFADAGAQWISVHAEACTHLHRTLQDIRARGCNAGVVCNPATPLEFAKAAAEHADFILLMSVNPGFGGQRFIPSFYRRCAELRSWLDAHDCGHVRIEVDGGVTPHNAEDIVRAGADILVSGNGVFSGDLHTNMKALREAADRGRSAVV